MPSIYCFETTYENVFKIGKTARKLNDRYKEHQKYFKEHKYVKEVYDCHTVEKTLMEYLNNDSNLTRRLDIGLEFYEGQYIDVLKYLEIIDDISHCRMQENFICHCCGKCLSSQSGLKNHMKIHNDYMDID